MTTIEQISRRLYFRDAPFAAKDALKAAGCSWDRDRRAWWIGVQKRAVAEQLLARIAGLSSDTRQEETVDPDARVILGRAEYRGKTYYVLFDGATRRGRGVKLAFRDGSRTFWARDLDALRILSRYDEPRSINALRAYAESRRNQAAGHADCPTCAARCTCDSGFCLHHHDGCDRCGAER